MEKNENQYQELTYRERLTTVDEEGKRVWVFPKKPKGKLTRLRRIVAWLLLLFFYAAPHLTWNGTPLLLFNFAGRKFALFGQVFYPQDFHLLVLALLSMIVFVVLFTVVYGRLFCGWACPQTVFLEFLYRPVEYLIDGDARQQRKLAAQPMDIEKLAKRAVKHSLFLLISFFTILTFLMYLIGAQRVFGLLAGWPLHDFPYLAGVLLFTLVHYFVFSWFREQVCTIVCPYGRLQGVMLDLNSIVVAYDYKRGEPRGKKGSEKGDCIDCNNCVEVCPTGIDIRNGTQLECINCTACIDACNTVMQKTQKPQGLIRYASERSIREGKTARFNARAIAYSAVLVVLLALTGYFLQVRGSIETTITRASGTLFQEYGENAVSNVYNAQLVNKTNAPIHAELRLVEPSGEIKLMGDPMLVEPGEVAKRMFLVVISRTAIERSKTSIIIGVFVDGKQIETVSSGFMAPNTFDKPTQKGSKTE